ncbi:RNA-directed DNA polymerase, eukaryota, partial [Tanacetum coccineum]
VEGYEDKDLVSLDGNTASSGESHKGGKKEVKMMVHAAKGTRQEWLEGSDPTHEFFTMDYGHKVSPLRGYLYTWAHKSASKMSKLDRFLVSESLLVEFPHLSGLCLDRHLSDHRPIIMFESKLDYDPIHFHSNGLSRLKKKLQVLKNEIKFWVNENRNSMNEAKVSIKCKLTEVDKLIDKGEYDNDTLIQRASLLNDLNDITSKEALDVSQKAKIRWSIEGDENSKYFHGILNSKRSQLSIRGILHEGD